MRPLSAAAKCSWVNFVLAILHLLGQPAGRLSMRQLFRKDFCFLLPRRQLPPQLLLGLRMLLLHRGFFTCAERTLCQIFVMQQLHAVRGGAAVTCQLLRRLTPSKASRVLPAHVF